MGRITQVIGIVVLAYGVINALSLLILPSGDSFVTFAQKYPVTFAADSLIPIAIGVYLVFIRKSKPQQEAKIAQPSPS